MERPENHIIVVAGEASGDARAAELIKEIKKLNPQLSFSGLGGAKMKEAGVKLYADLTALAVVGFSEVLKHLTQLKTFFNLVIAQAETLHPVAVLLVDYPGFNLRLARELKKRNVKVIYYISPQVWAWNAKRVNLIKCIVDHMIVFFEFEKDFYARHHYPVTCVGHPLVDQVKVQQEVARWRSEQGLKTATTIGLLPGSRVKEVEHILPIMLRAARYLHHRNPGLQFLLIQAPTISDSLLHRHLASSRLPITVVRGQTYEGINACDFCFVASGTATLEAALLSKPMAVVYKTSLLTWILARLLIRIPSISLVNIMAGKKIVPECVQFQATPSTLARHAIRILSDQKTLKTTQEDLARVKQTLGDPGASARAAQAILQFLSSGRQ